MAYTDIELETSDLDWFIKMGSRYIHAASGGGVIPDIIRYGATNEALLEEINYSAMRNYYPVQVNPNLKQILALNDIEDDIRFILNTLKITFDDPIETYIEKVYARSFIEYARMGFWSFDKTNPLKPNDPNYHLVAWPMKKVKEIPTIDGLIPKLAILNNIRIPHQKSVDLIRILNNLSVP